MIWRIYDELRWIWVCAVYDVSHLLPQPHPTTFNPTLPHNILSPHHEHPAIPLPLPYHTTPLQGSDANNTSTIRAKCLAEHCAGPENDSQRGGGGGQNYNHNGVGASPGCLLGGAKLPQCLATAAQAITFCASPEKVAQQGGGGGWGGGLR